MCRLRRNVRDGREFFPVLLLFSCGLNCSPFFRDLFSIAIDFPVKRIDHSNPWHFIEMRVFFKDCFNGMLPHCRSQKGIPDCPRARFLFFP